MTKKRSILAEARSWATKRGRGPWLRHFWRRRFSLIDKKVRLVQDGILSASSSKACGVAPNVGHMINLEQPCAFEYHFPEGSIA